jgi:diguanylate cyclase (GGDEF)-like protein
VIGFLRAWRKEERRSLRGQSFPWRRLAAGSLVLASLLAADGWIRMDALRADYKAKLQQAKAILQTSADGIARSTFDWGKWDSLYAWFGGQEPSFPDTDLEATTLFDGGALFLFFETDGRPRLSYSRRGYNHPSDRALLACTQSNLGRLRSQRDRIQLICSGASGEPYVGVATWITNSDSTAPPRGSLAMLEPLIQPAFGPAHNEPLRWLLHRIPQLSSPPPAAPRQGGEGPPTPLMAPNFYGPQGASLALVEEQLQFPWLRQWLKDLLIGLAFGAGLLGVRTVMLMERRRQLLIRRRIERSGERRLREASRNLDLLLTRMGMGPFGPEGEDGVLARLIEGESAQAPPLLAAAPVEQKLERLTSRFERFLERASNLALLDPLTKLPNRRYFIEQMDRQMERCRSQQRRLAILFVDVDKFKNINDSYGHAVGDAALVMVADHLRQQIRGQDFLGRYGGDEFALLIELGGVADASDRTTRTSLMDLAGRLASPFHGAVELEGMKVELTISVGIALIEPSDADGEAAMRRSDIAMYRAKKSSGSHIAFFDAQDSDGHLDSYRLYGDLRQAIRDNAFQVVFQPILDRNGQVQALEALARWTHPERGAVAPDVFLDLAERYRQMNALTDHLIQLSLDNFKPWAGTHGTLRLSLNLPPSKLADPQLVQQLDRELQIHGLPAHRLTIEVTERSVLQTNALVSANLRQLRERGVLISLDDFGTGYSSLSLLGTLQPDEVKIDRSFVMAMDADPYARQIVTLVVDMALRMGLRVVAEGVEDQGVLDQLLDLGVSHFQGFHFSRPLPSAQLQQWWPGPAIANGSRAGAIGEDGD